VKAELDTIAIVIRKLADEEWPSGLEQQRLVDDIEREFEVVSMAGPYVSGEWYFHMRETQYKAVLARVNELIHEHIGG